MCIISLIFCGQSNIKTTMIHAPALNRGPWSVSGPVDAL
jgi:hypothetical protein